MQARRNYTRLFEQKSDNSSKSFIPAIDICTKRERFLKKTAANIVDELKEAFRNILEYLPQSLIDEMDNREIEIVQNLKPKFRAQGSFTYQTVNDPVPEYTPPQEVDIDIGCYLPMKYAEEIPEITHKLLFKIIDSVIIKIAVKHENWEPILNKDTCSRLKTNQGAHIDVVPYVTPDDQFELISSSMESSAQFNKQYLAEDAYLEFFAKEMLKADKVNMAHREDGWKESDPKLVTDWFITQCDDKKYLRYVSRILKAWRDFTWPEGQGMSSISIMVMVSKIYDSHSTPDNLMDALLTVTSELPGLLQSTQYLPVEPNDAVWPRKSDLKLKDEIINNVKQLNSILQHCKYGDISKQLTVNQLRAAFGDRLPNRPDWIDEVTFKQPKTKTAAIVTSNKPRGNTTAA